MVILLILIVGMVTGYDLQCPSKSEWHLRANVSCFSEDKYVCLFHLLEKKYKENCFGSDLSSIGNKLVFQPLFNLAECSAGRYQPVVFTTHGNSECILIKSKCDEEGQVVYSNGSTKNDIACRCDYTKGYTFISKPKNSCFCLPPEEYCSCFRAKCLNLSSDYQCINDAVIKPKTACQEIQQQISLNKDNTIVQSIDSNTHSDMRVSDSHHVSYIIICIIAVIFVWISKAQFSSQFKDKPCVNLQTGSYDCCYNFEKINDVCVECKIGTVAISGEKCIPCTDDMYGFKCLSYCKCENHQRCDAEVGCIWNRTIKTRNEEFTTTHLIKDSTKNGTTGGIYIYTACIVGIFVIVGFLHFLRTHRKRLSSNIRKNDDIEMRSEIDEQVYMEIDNDH